MILGEMVGKMTSLLTRRGKKEFTTEVTEDRRGNGELESGLGGRKVA